MSFENSNDEFDSRTRARIDRLQTIHRRRFGGGVVWVAGLVMLFVAWANYFKIDEVAKAHGEVIAQSRVQVIQSVDGGQLVELLVREGDRVKRGQILARLDPTRSGASLGETAARLSALRARVIRLRAEVSEKDQPVFPADLLRTFPETVAVEQDLFRQRRMSLSTDIRLLEEAAQISRQELAMVSKLNREGDASGAELLRAQRSVNDAETRLAGRRNKFLEDAGADLVRAEDDAAQNDQVLTRRTQERKDTIFVAQVAGIVKNVRVTTLGGVLRAGEELMQIVPLDDDLVVEAKILPADIARIESGLQANIRLDPFDYTIHGSVPGRVIYVSADTLKEEGRQGTETYYRVHITPDSYPMVSSTGKKLDVLPGMTAQVDIRTGERTLMNYLLKPLRKTLFESMRER